MPIPLLPILVVLATGGAVGGLTYLVNSTYEGKILQRLKEIKKPAFPSFPLVPYGLSDENAMTVIGKMRYYVKNHGYAYPASIKDLSKLVYKDMKFSPSDIAPNQLTAFLMEMQDIKPTDGDLYEYLRGGVTDRDKTTQRITEVIDAKKLPSIVQPKKWLYIGALIGGLYLLGPFIRNKLGKIGSK